MGAATIRFCWSGTTPRGARWYARCFGSQRRAHREATALSSLEHPNIVRCFGVHEPVYVLMEYLQGPSLSDFIQGRPDGRLSVSDSIRVAIHLGAALEHIHGKGFLHLDVKPDNVVIVHGRPVLFDFGSLRVRTAERPQQVHGTDPYIAPEEWLLEEAGRIRGCLQPRGHAL